MKPVLKKEGEALDHLIKRFRRRVSKEGILDEYKKRQFNLTTGEKRREKHLNYIKRCQKSGRF